jgi:integrase
MSDIRRRKGKKGTTYQVRYPSKSSVKGYAYKAFETLKEARAFLESGSARQGARPSKSDVHTVAQATDLWLKACKKEGINGREPVTDYTLKNYEYRAEFIKAFDWTKDTIDVAAPDIVAFRSWLLGGDISRDLAGKVLSSLHSVMKEMVIRGHLLHNPVTGISIRAESRYQEPVVIPTRQDVVKLLQAADRLANSKNKLTARTWLRYRPMLYLAVDSGMRPQEYLAISRSALRDKGVYVDRAIEGGGTEISVTKTPAGRRFIELSPETLAMIRHYAENHAIRNDHDLVFPTDTGQWQSRRNWQRRGFNVACEAAGLTNPVVVDGKAVFVDGKPVHEVKYRPYDLRHFFASMLIEKRTNLKKIQTLMGHTNIETTLNVYGHLLEENERKEDVPIGLLGGLLQSSCGESVAQSA